MQGIETSPRTKVFGKFGDFDLEDWRRVVEVGGQQAPLPSSSDRIALALERLVEKFVGTTVTEVEPVVLEPAIAGDRLYSVEEAAKLLRFNAQTVRRHIRQGRYGLKDESKRLWVRQSEIDHFLLTRKKVHGK